MPRRKALERRQLLCLKVFRDEKEPEMNRASEADVTEIGDGAPGRTPRRMRSQNL